MNEKSLFRNYDEDDIISKILFLYFSFMHGAIGLFLLLNDVTVYKSKTLDGMAELLPMYVWGTILVISSLCFFITAIQENKPQFIFMVSSGLTGFFVFGLLAMASMELSVNQTNTINYALISSIDLMIAIVGGVALWRRRFSRIKQDL